MYRKTLYQLTTLLIASFSALGCNPTSLPTASNTGIGQFEGTVVAQWSDNGREMILQQPISFVDSANKRWDAPAGSVVDGASIPSVFWSAIGGPFEGKYRNASVVHDVYCEEMTEPWENVHQMFYEACRSGGVAEAQSKIMYYAVYHFGPRWQMVSEADAPAIDQQAGVSVRRDRQGRHMARYQPVPPTMEEVEQIAEFVSDEAPTTDQVRQMDREQLHRRPRRSDVTKSPSEFGQQGQPQQLERRTGRNLQRNVPQR